MRSLRTPVALAVSVAALVSVQTSFADERTAPVRIPSTPTAQQQQQVPAPMPPTQQQAPVQQEPVQQVPSSAAPLQPRTTAGDPVPSSTTRTTQAQYIPPSDTVTERTVERRPNSTLLSTGVGLFVLSYGGSVIAGALSDRDADKRLFIPVAGPWMNLADRSCTNSTPCGENEDVAKAMIVTSGVVQGAGVLLALGSLIVPETISTRERTKTAKPSVKVLPVSFNAGAGIGAIGRF